MIPSGEFSNGGRPPEPFLAVPAVGDVLELREDRDDLAVVVGDDAVVPLTDDLLAVLADVLVDAVVAPLGGGEFVGDRVDVLVASLRDERLPGVAPEFGLRVAEDLLAALVQPDDLEVLVVLQHPERRLLDEQREPLLTGLDLVFRPVLLDGVFDPVREDGVLAGPGLLLEVLGHPGRDGVAGDLLAALAGE